MNALLWLALSVSAIMFLAGVHLLGITSRLRKLERFGVTKRHRLFHTYMFPK